MEMYHDGWLEIVLEEGIKVGIEAYCGFVNVRGKDSDGLPILYAFSTDDGVLKCKISTRSIQKKTEGMTRESV